MSELNYQTYLKIDELLSLQQPLSDPQEHDEMLFIMIHQVYELWFKQLLHELARAGTTLSTVSDVSACLPEACGTFKRCRTIMKTLVGQFDALETMSPMSFVAFRDRLETASGVQSVQFRELETVFGQRNRIPPPMRAIPSVAALLERPSIVDHFYKFLQNLGVTVPAECLERDLSKSNEPSESIQEQLVSICRTRPDVVILFETMVDFDEGFQEWRFRHVRIVERTIGSKAGTAAHSIGYLRDSIFTPIFHDLWDVRSRL